MTASRPPERSLLPACNTEAIDLSGGFSDQCCDSTTLSIFHAEIKGIAGIQPEAERTLAFAHGLGGTAWAKPC
jgi:nicotinamidase-related amidase